MKYVLVLTKLLRVSSFSYFKLYFANTFQPKVELTGETVIELLPIFAT